LNNLKTRGGVKKKPMLKCEPKIKGQGSGNQHKAKGEYWGIHKKS